MFLKGSSNKTFLSKLLTPANRAFSRSSIQAYNSAFEATIAAETPESAHAFNSVEFQAAPAYSRALLLKKRAEEAAEAEWLS